MHQPAALAQPTTGQTSPGMSALDQTMQGLLSTYSIPGAALAVSRNGILVYARGFGYADVTAARPVQPDSLFRVASVSKTFTAVAVMELVEQGKIQLDQPAFALLPDLAPTPGETLNPALAKVTVRELLNMTGGWDRNIVGDPLDTTLAVAAATGYATPLSCSNVIQYMLGRPLQHTPGSTYAYSNFGYCVLGQIVSEVSGMPYEDFVRLNVLKPLGIQRTKQSDGLISDVANGEVTYYDYPGAPLQASAYDANAPKVPRQYGGHDFLASNASGSWATTPIDLLRFVNGIDGTRGGPLLQPATITQMQTEAPAFGGAPNFYGLGFSMRALTGGGFNWSKDGGLPGTAAYLYRGADKLDWAVVFNSAPAAAGEDSTTGFEGDYVAQIQAALGKVTSWPATDQFGSYQSTLLQPQFSTTGPPVENAASYVTNITPGSWVSLYGTNLATATRTWYNSEFNGNNLPFYVDGVSVTIGGLPAPIYYVSPTQIDVQAPLGTVVPTTADVVITHDGQSSAAMKATVKFISPALFTYTGGGITFAAAVAQSGSVIGDPAIVPGTVKSKVGDYVSLYANSLLGAKSGTIDPPHTLQTFPTVTIGGINAPVTYAGLVSPGLFQINVQVPPGVQAGDAPVVITYSGVPSQAGVVLPISQ